MKASVTSFTTKEEVITSNAASGVILLSFNFCASCRSALCQVFLALDPKLNSMQTTKQHVDPETISADNIAQPTGG